jgi:hypothetical protein
VPSHASYELSYLSSRDVTYRASSSFHRC